MAGRNRLKNLPVLHNEIKEKTVALKPTAWTNIKTKAFQKEISASELIEQWVRETLKKDTLGFSP